MRALITGITGQDGGFLAELMLQKGYEVHGIVRRSATHNTTHIDRLLEQDKIALHYGDLGDGSSLARIVHDTRPDELYNLAAQSHVAVSFAEPEYTGNINGLGVIRLLEAVRLCGIADKCRFYQASTSELFGTTDVVPQNENTPFHPSSPYAVAKQHAFWAVKQYRTSYGMFACNGILFNHESERRGEDFVTRKITLAAARIACGVQDTLELGNLSSLRDWGYAKDYVECMWRMLQQDEPNDYVIATGEQHTVREFATWAFEYAGIPLEWQGAGIHEVGLHKKTGRTLVRVNPSYYRPTDVTNLMGDPSKAVEQLGWNPHKTSCKDLCRIMTEHDMSLVMGELS